ncbi:MAG TPA: MerR family transcriptional regulator [Rhodobacteraceae bacterium]|nr:MerR family transcriptional regulator [Paracoccaceae bacterium]
MYSIGELSRQTGVKIPTIRYYEQIGLIDPSERSAGNQRRYTQDGFARLSFIRHSRDLGFSLNDIRELLELSQHPERECSDAHGIAARHLAGVRIKIAKMKQLEKELKRISNCEAGKLADCAVLETLADHRLCLGEH